MLKEFREFILRGDRRRAGLLGAQLHDQRKRVPIRKFHQRAHRVPDRGDRRVFFVIRPVNALLSRLRTEPPVAEETHPCPECLSEIPMAARRCAFCTTQVSATR
jgi:hypothetical protein